MIALEVVTGGQFGSEAKGHVTAQVLRRNAESLRRLQINMRVAGPNAGHTAYTEDEDRTAFALRQVPVGAVLNDPNILLAIGPGSEIDPPVLMDEIQRLEAAGIPVGERLFIDPEATILDPEHHEAETNQQMHERLGSTGKGIGAARADRIMRRARRLIDAPEVLGDLRDLLPTSKTFPIHILPMQQLADRIEDINQHTGVTSIVIEGTQGYGLGLHAGFYPFCTSSDCRAIDFVAMSGIGTYNVQVAWVVFRPYPIRVAGNSGPLKDETTWDALGLDPEFTTVTKKMRRVGQWDGDLARAAIKANGGVPKARIALTMADQLSPAIRGVTSWEDLKADNVFMEHYHRIVGDLGTHPLLITTSPNTAVWTDL